MLLKYNKTYCATQKYINNNFPRNRAPAAEAASGAGGGWRHGQGSRLVIVLVLVLVLVQVQGQRPRHLRHLHQVQQPPGQGPSSALITSSSIITHFHSLLIVEMGRVQLHFSCTPPSVL